MNKHPLDGLDDDIREHIARETEDNIARGMSPEEARRAALRAFGNVALVREDTRAVWIPPLLDQFAQDVRYALRGMRRNPGFTLAAVSMLALGLGLAAGGYTVFNGLFIRGWAVPDNSQVFRAHAEREGAPAGGFIPGGFSVGTFEHLRSNARAADIVALRRQNLRVSPSAGDGGVYTIGMLASANAIEALRIPLQRGTGFGGTLPSGPPRVVLSDATWRRLFDSDRNIIGRTVWLSGVPAVIVGIAAPGFDGLGDWPLDLFVELGAAAALKRWDADDLTPDQTPCCVMVAGRVRQGWDRTQVQQELALLTSQYRQATNQPPLTILLAATAPGESLLRGPRKSVVTITFALLGAALLLLLLLTCANVGNLYLARALRRRREIAIRLSLGASRARVVRQLLTEGLALAVLAGTCAYLMTMSVPALMHALDDEPPVSMFAPDWRVATFIVGAVVATCLLVSLAPALQTTRVAWRGAAPTMSPRTGNIRGLVLAAQIAIALVLVLSAVLLTRSIQHAVTVPAGFALHTTSAARIVVPAEDYDDRRRAELTRAVIRAVRESGSPVGIAGTTPASREASLSSAVQLPGSEVLYPCRLVPIDAAAAGVLELALASGRWAADDRGEREVVINETLARQVWPDGGALGRELVLSFDKGRYTVVGVARDAHLTSLGEVEPMIHVPLTAGMPILLARTSPQLTQQLRALVRSVDPRLDVAVTPLSATVGQTMRNAIAGAATAGGLGAVALLLAVIGVFGVFSFLVEERRQEIGIRLALGASRGQIFRALLGATRTAITGGLVVGLGLSTVAGVLLQRFLFGLSPLDPVSYAAVAMLLAMAAMAATAIPVRRALRVDPAVTLRAE